jgi:hypothetical protein
VVHHSDYLGHRDNHSLCGIALKNPTALTQLGAADTACPDCQAKLMAYHLVWWREKALAATAELEALRAKDREPDETADSADGQPAAGEIAEPTEAEPKTFLDHARRELEHLCQQYDGAVPYFRLKNAMQAFSDRLGTDERVLLAQEIGGDGTLIRWSTTEVAALGWQVTNSPVQGESEAQWDAWIDDSQRGPTTTKKRFGRSR